MPEPPVSPSQAKPAAEQLQWFQKISRPVLFLIISLALVGGYLAFSIPVSVFPSTDFPRIVIGVDNGVMPIDQMLVTITRPLEESVNNVPGLQRVLSITSRGSAEVDLGTWTWYRLCSAWMRSPPACKRNFPPPQNSKPVA